MEFAVSDLGARRKEIAVTVPSSAVKNEFVNAYAEVSTQVDIPGFRKGKIPRTVLEKRFGEHVANDVCDRLVSTALHQAAEKEDLPIIGQPEFDLDRSALKDSSEFSFKVKVDLKPVVTMPDYEGVEVNRDIVNVSDEDVDSYVSNLQQRYGKEVDVAEGELQEKDAFNANCTLIVDGNEIESREDVYVSPVAGWIFGTKCEKLQDELKGKSVGDEFTLSVEIPDTYKTEELRGKSAELKVAITKIRRTELPELNDAFAEQLGLDDLEELKDEVRENIEREKKGSAEAAARQQLTDALVEKTEIEVSENMLAKYKDYVVSRSLQQLQMYGLPAEMIEERKAELEKTADEVALKEIKLDNLLIEIADKERIYVTEKEVSDGLASAAVQQQMDVDKFAQEMQNRQMIGQFRDDLRKQKVIDFLMEKAKVTEVEPSTESSEQENK